MKNCIKDLDETGGIIIRIMAETSVQNILVPAPRLLQSSALSLIELTLRDCGKTIFRCADPKAENYVMTSLRTLKRTVITMVSSPELRLRYLQENGETPDELAPIDEEERRRSVEALCDIYIAQ